MPCRRGTDSKIVLDLLASDVDTIAAEAAPTDAVFALIWLSPLPQLLNLPTKAIISHLQADLSGILDGLAMPHVVQICYGRTAAVVELIPVANDSCDMKKHLTLCEDRLINRSELCRGTITSCIISVSCTLAASARPPLPPGEWCDVALLVSKLNVSPLAE